jgi:hypothetical protein
VGEVWGGADEEDGVAVDEAGHTSYVDLVVWRRAGNEVDFDAKIGASFAEGCVASLWKNPRSMVSTWRC